MKKPSLILLFVISIFSINVYSQVVWEKINTPSENRHYSVAVANNGDIYLGDLDDVSGGVLRSTNNGESWELIGLEGYSVYSLSFNHEGNLLAGTSNGIYLYDLTSSEWDQKFSPVSNIITINLGFNNTIFAGGADLWRSSDDGYTWQEIIEVEGGVRDFAVLSQDTVYVGIKNYIGGIGGVSRSIDEGDTWENIGLDLHYVTTLGLNNSGDLYAGCTDHHHYGYGGVFKLEHGANIWDTLSFWPRITSMVITQEDIIYCGFYTTTQYQGGVIRSDDGGESWVIDTAGMGNIGVKDLVMDNNERLYALAGYVNTNLYRTSLPVSIQHYSEIKPITRTYCSPNPFTNSTTIFYNIIEPAQILFKVFDNLGKEVKAIDLSTQNKGQHKIKIDMAGMPPGIYYYSMYVNGQLTDTKKMIVR